MPWAAGWACEWQSLEVRACLPECRHTCQSLTAYSTHANPDPIRRRGSDGRCGPACSVIARSAAHADPVATTATVMKVVDGETVEIVDDVRGRLRIRLLGIDTPETKKPGYTVGCWGPQATEFAKSTLLGQRVAFVTDPSQGMYDRFGRTYRH